MAMSESPSRKSLTEELQALDQELATKTKAIIDKDPLLNCMDNVDDDDECWSCSQSHPNWSCNAVKKTGLSRKKIIEIQSRQKKELTNLTAKFRKRALQIIIVSHSEQHNFEKIKKILDTVKRAKDLFPNLVD